MIKNQKGFAALEGILILVIIAMIGGTGYYVWHSKNNANKTLDAAQNEKISAPTMKKSSPKDSIVPSAQKHLVIKEWGVQFAYTASDTYTYKLPAGQDNINIIDVISKNLADTFGCKDFGAGEIIRSLPNDPALPSQDQPTVQEYAKQNPGKYTLLKGYYYNFKHDQAACSDQLTAAVSQAQNNLNATISNLVSKVEPIPQ